MKDQNYVRSNLPGKTTLWLKDYKNLNNFAKITVEVQPIAQFEWLEDHIEVSKENSTVVLYAIAKDQRGRSFTNCSSLQLEYNATGEGSQLQRSEKLSWDQLQAMVKHPESADLIQLRDYFNENPQANFIDSVSQSKLSQEGFNMLTYNSFGICDQAHLKTNLEGGLTRVQASLGSSRHQARSSIAEVAAYS